MTRLPARSAAGRRSNAAAGDVSVRGQSPLAGRSRSVAARRSLPENRAPERRTAPGPGRPARGRAPRSRMTPTEPGRRAMAMSHPDTGRSGSSGSWYAATAPAAPPRPALAGRERADVCVVGAGFTGISAALHLAERGYSGRRARGGAGRLGGERAQRRAGGERTPRVDGRSRTRPRSRPAPGALWALCRGGEGDHRRAHRPSWHRVRLAPGQPARVHARAPHGVDGGRGGVLPPAFRLPRVPDAVPGGDARGSRERVLRRGADGRGAAGTSTPSDSCSGWPWPRPGAGARIFEGSRVERIRWGGPAEVSTAQGDGGGGARRPRRQRPSRPPRVAASSPGSCRSSTTSSPPSPSGNGAPARS